ncbi:YggU family protein [Puniceicoccales bacterium CK1056]|uniref:UPF0235 protein G0Q06_12725 n=1 Tax=Oceanipulchritudo coccoides TaxID=2706888 RepID=A0A6B2M4W5_9BACT|nr:DUF167 domain-containing protein [Oceanipulchritudo coccoides]NDV63322.1 YggU family protein [Oceanipulchritudo coccoides]
MSRRISVRVIPNAGRDQVVGLHDGVLKIKLQAVPEDGKANKALCELLAKHFGCLKRKVTIVAGEKSRNKVIEVPGEISLL